MKENEIEEYMEKQYPNEAAALCIGDCFYILGTIGYSSTHTLVDSIEVANILDMAKDDDKIIFIHSHIDCPTDMSKLDLEMKELWGMEWWIYRIDNGDITDVKIFSR